LFLPCFDILDLTHSERADGHVMYG
jgi:hypothetical protein